MDLWNKWNELGELLEKGGFVGPFLVIGALGLWYCLGYRFVLLYLGDSRGARGLLEALRQGGLVRPRGVVAKAAAQGFQYIGRAHLKEHLEERFAPFEEALSQHATLAQSIVRAAPLLGLLGTVSGMIETFEALGDMTLSSQGGGGVAGGISEALFSTQMGLLVAVPGLLIGRLLDRRQQVLQGELTKLKELLCLEEKR